MYSFVHLFLLTFVNGILLGICNTVVAEKFWKTRIPVTGIRIVLKLILVRVPSPVPSTFINQRREHFISRNTFLLEDFPWQGSSLPAATNIEIFTIGYAKISSRVCDYIDFQKRLMELR